MKNEEKKSCITISMDEHSRIPHVICLEDFNTSYPVLNRIERVVREINEYIKWKKDHIE